MSNSANYSLVAIHCKYRIGSHYNTSFRAGESYYNRIALHTSNAFFEYIVKSNNSLRYFMDNNLPISNSGVLQLFLEILMLKLELQSIVIRIVTHALVCIKK